MQLVLCLDYLFAMTIPLWSDLLDYDICWMADFVLKKFQNVIIRLTLLSFLLFPFKLVQVTCRVTLADQTTFDAKVVGFDQDKDVAVLRVDAPKDKLRPMPVGVSADLLVGQKVYAIGNPVSNTY